MYSVFLGLELGGTLTEVRDLVSHGLRWRWWKGREWGISESQKLNRGIGKERIESVKNKFFLPRLTTASGRGGIVRK